MTGAELVAAAQRYAESVAYNVAFAAFVASTLVMAVVAALLLRSRP